MLYSGLICGIVAIIIPWFALSVPILGFLAVVIGVVGIVLSVKQMQAGQGAPIPLIGLIVSIVGTIIALPFFFCFIQACRIGCAAGAGINWMFSTGL